ncbi:MAG: type II secretion system protein [Verrucomicrobiota bacterium]
MIKLRSRKGFTLVELLVVMTIIALIIGLAVPGLAAARKVASRISDTNNARNLVLALNLAAQDSNGLYPTGASSTEVFEELVHNRYIDDERVFAGTNTPNPPKIDPGNLPAFTLDPRNVAWAYVDNLTTNSPSRCPLVLTKGVKAFTNLGVVSPELPAMASADSPWGPDGVVVGTVGGSAEFIKANPNGTVDLGITGAENPVLSPSY